MTTPQMDWLDDQRRKRAVSSDDIATLLRHAEDNGICEWQVLIDAADEIERLREREQDLRMHAEQDACENERLRAAGDALAKQASQPCRCVKAHDGAINETCAPCAAYFDWQEARREQ